jgi:CubicO group peptidase (beta-lactamase class C family)
MRGDAVLSGLEFKHHSTHWGSQYFKLRDAGPKSKFGDQFVLFEVLGTCGVFRCRASWLSMAQFTRLVSEFANITLSAGLMETKSPLSLGLNPDRIALACEILEDEIDKRSISAASLTIARNGALAAAHGFGHVHPDRSESVTADSVFLLASISKPISVCALMLLVERGDVGLNDPVQMHLPEFVGEHKEAVRVRHLLSHTSGMPDMLPENVALRKAHAPMSGFVEAALKTPLLFLPGSAFRYQSKGILLAGEIVERKAGVGLRDFLKTEMFDVVGMHQTSLGLGGVSIEETVWCGATSDDSRSETDYGWNSPYWRDAGHPWGGVHSTGPDLALLMQSFLDRGVCKGGEVMSPATAAVMVQDQNVDLRAPWGLGWGLRDSRVWAFFGDICSPRTFGHCGATGTVAWADPSTGLSCVILANDMVEEGRMLRRVSNVVASAIVD